MSVINQKEYLKKYLNIGGDKDKRKKKKKKSNIIKDRLRIIDDDIDVFNPDNLTAQELDEILTAEDAPQVVGVIDDRPLALRLDDYRKSSKWKLVGSDDEQETVKKPELNSKTDISSDRNAKLTKNKSYDSDLSPVRGNKNDSSSDISPPRRSNNKDSDASAPRTKSKYDANPTKHSYRNKSPERNSRKKSRWNSENSPKCSIQINSDSDLSPSREKSRDKTSNCELKSPHHQKKIYSNMSPHSENFKHKLKSKSSFDKRSYSREDYHKDRFNADSYRSLSRKSNYSQQNDQMRKSSYNSNERNFKNRNNSDSDVSPPRKRLNQSPPGRPDRRSIKSPLRRPDKIRSEDTSHEDKKRYKYQHYEKKRRDGNEGRRGSSSEPSTSSKKKMSKTLDGKTAGLQNANDLKEETVNFKKREDELFKKMSEDVSGMNAAPIIRDRKTGKKRDFEKEAEEHFEKMKKQDEQKKKYDQWGKGLKQVDDYKEKLEQDLHEMNKPLARYADDEDLERYLKEQERDGDPMLKYIRKKKRKDAVASGKPMKQVYEGEFMPNRFGIPPGHRWDGVDRSNGYEKSWFSKENAKKAVEEEVYKWSTEDM